MAVDLSRNEDLQRLFLLEFLIDNVKFDYNKIDLDKSLVETLKQTCVRFNILNFPVIEVCEDDFCPTLSNYKASDVIFKCGKSCFFSLSSLPPNTESLKLGATIIRQKDESPPVIIGATCIELDRSFINVLTNYNHITETGEASKTLKDVFSIRDDRGIIVGTITLFIRLSCFGKAIITHFKIPQDNEAGYFFTNSNETEQNVPSNNIPPGLSNFVPGTSMNQNVWDQRAYPENMPNEMPGRAHQSMQGSQGSGSLPMQGMTPGGLQGIGSPQMQGMEPGAMQGIGSPQMQSMVPGAMQGTGSPKIQGMEPGGVQGFGSPQMLRMPPEEIASNYLSNSPEIHSPLQGYQGIYSTASPGMLNGMPSGGIQQDFDFNEFSNGPQAMYGNVIPSGGAPKRPGSSPIGWSGNMPYIGDGSYIPVDNRTQFFPELGMGEHVGTCNYSFNSLKSRIEKDMCKNYKELSVSINGHEFTVNVLRKSRKKREISPEFQMCGRLPSKERSETDEATDEEMDRELEKLIGIQEGIREIEVSQIPSSNVFQTSEKSKSNTEFDEKNIPLKNMPIKTHNNFSLCECDIPLPKGFRLPGAVSQKNNQKPPSHSTLGRSVSIHSAPDSLPTSHNMESLPIMSALGKGASRVSGVASTCSSPMNSPNKKKAKKNKETFCLKQNCPKGFSWPPDIPQRIKIIREPCCTPLPMFPGSVAMKGEQVVLQMANDILNNDSSPYYKAMKDNKKSPYVLKLGATNLTNSKLTKMIMELPVPELKLKEVEINENDTQYFESDFKTSLNNVKKSKEKKKKGKNGGKKGKGKKGKKNK